MVILKNEEVKIHIFWETECIFCKNVTYDDVKSDWKTKLYTHFR